MIHKAWCSIEVPYYFSRSYIKFQGHTGWKFDDLDQICTRLLGQSQLTNPSDLPCFFYLDLVREHSAPMYLLFTPYTDLRGHFGVANVVLVDYVAIIVSSENFQELSPRTRVTSIQKVKVRGQRSRSQKSQPNFTDYNSILNLHMMMKWYI